MIPEGLVESCRGDPERMAWLAGLAKLVEEFAARWSLRVQPPFVDSGGTCAWVAPVTLPDGGDAVLKLAMPHMEGRDEIAGLRFWNGSSVVRLLDADEPRGAMLLERCKPGTLLRAIPEADQDVVIAGLLRNVWRPPAPPFSFRPLRAMLDYWSRESIAAIDQAPDGGLIRAGVELFSTLDESTETRVVLFTDLHADNVLSAERSPWLAIDPKPFVGDPAYDATQHLFNCVGRMHDRPIETMARFADLLGVSGDRVRLWMFARAAVESQRERDSHPWPEIARRIAP